MNSMMGVAQTKYSAYSAEIVGAGDWYEDESGRVYIIPPYHSLHNLIGPTNMAMRMLRTVTDNGDGGRPSQRQLDRYELSEVSVSRRRWSPDRGYYCV